MPSIFEEVTPISGSQTTIQPDLVAQYVLPYINWIILAISLFVIIYSASVYYKRRKNSGSD